MSQHAHARALHLLQDNGHDRIEAEYILKRLYDFGFTARERSPNTSGTSPPAEVPDGTVTAMHPAKAARVAARQQYIARMRADVETARVKAAEELAAGIEAAQLEEAQQRSAAQRALKVAEVLAAME